MINEIQVGGFDATLRDFEIPTRYGLRQTIGDTLGVGGVFRALRTIPVVLAIADDMAELCPEARLLNYTNPMAMLCWAVWEGQPPPAVVGLCHSVQNTHEQLAEIVGVPEPEIDFLTAGVNHQAWVLRFERDGESLYSAARRGDRPRPRGPGAAGAHRALPPVRPLPHRVQRAQRRVRALVHVATTISSSATGSRSDEYMRRSQENLREYEEITRQAGRRRAAASSLREGELAPRYIHSLLTGERRGSSTATSATTA